ncbi:membrane protein [Sphaerisporangium siamense]|uniref:CBS domain containing-hemolysin-like protein n=1 Tax=Sphaerisporangium siamense TaxID=795645 RepID=A0A7W7G6X2_9ACTN|nr:hemolysin family protein [Sphaerisporangium siamense]MBB4699998.1 CBS domain containing-hemolysin-like protein [Sphaerisporangium siamense]GII84683.1 membrane protein [Sphaerisporangium siamense]
MSTVTALLLGVLLLIGNGLFVAAEFAVVSSRRHRLEEAAAGGSLARTAGRAALRNARQLSLMLAGAQLGITLCSLGLAMVTEPAIEHLLEPVFGLVGLPPSMRVAVAYVIALAIITFLHMVVGEMAPKSWALTHPERAAMGLALPFRAFTWIARPIIAALNGLANGLLRAFGVRPRDELGTTRTPPQLAMLVGESGRMGLLDREEHDLLTRALRVQSQPIERLMVPIGEATAVPAGASGDLVRDVAVASGHVRLLVNDGSPQDVLGVLHVRDTLIHPGVPPEKLITELPRLESATTLPEAVARLQEAHAHVGLVTDPSGAVAGLVSLTDLVGELLNTRTRPDAAARKPAARQATGASNP